MDWNLIIKCPRSLPPLCLELLRWLSDLKIHLDLVMRWRGYKGVLERVFAWFRGLMNKCNNLVSIVSPAGALKSHGQCFFGVCLCARVMNVPSTCGPGCSGWGQKAAEDFPSGSPHHGIGASIKVWRQGPPAVGKWHSDSILQLSEETLGKIQHLMGL